MVCVNSVSMRRVSDSVVLEVIVALSSRVSGSGMASGGVSVSGTVSTGVLWRDRANLPELNWSSDTRNPINWRSCTISFIRVRNSCSWVGEIRPSEVAFLMASSMTRNFSMASRVAIPEISLENRSKIAWKLGPIIEGGWMIGWEDESLIVVTDMSLLIGVLMGVSSRRKKCDL